MPDTIVLIHGFWVTPRSWEDWKARYEARGYTRARARLPGLRGGGRGAQRGPDADRGADRAGDHRAPRGVVGGARRAADHHGPLGRRRVHAAAARPRLRRRRRGDQLGADRGRQAGPAVAGQGDVPGAEEPGQPAPRGRLHLRAVAVRVHQHVPRGGVAALYERYHIPASGTIFWGSALANIHPGKDDTYVNYKNDDRAPLLFISGSEDHLMPPSDPAVQRQALQVGHDHRGQGVRGAAPAARRGRLGGGRRLRARLGARARGSSRA